MPRALHNMTLPQSPANACTLCSELPAELWVNTGRDEAFPDVVRRLLRLGLSDDDDVWQCPQCNAQFAWTNLPQYYGSGNNDEERLIRLNAEQAATVHTLLHADAVVQAPEPFLQQAFRSLRHALVFALLHHHARQHPHAFSGLLPTLVAAHAARGELPLYGLLDHYCGNDPARIRAVLAALEAHGPGISKSAQYLHKTLLARLQADG